jgi:hypothetical protein
LSIIGGTIVVLLLLTIPGGILINHKRISVFVNGIFMELLKPVVTGVISGVLAGIIVPFLWEALQLLRERRKSEEFKIVLKGMPPKIGNYKIKFGVLHVQNDDETIKNAVHWFIKRGTRELHAAIRHPKNLGFQYKCFVDIQHGYDFSEVSTCLTNAGYTYVSEGRGIPDRIWFILPGQTAEDARGNLNNYNYPV